MEITSSEVQDGVTLEESTSDGLPRVSLLSSETLDAESRGVDPYAFKACNMSVDTSKLNVSVPGMSATKNVDELIAKAAISDESVSKILQSHDVYPVTPLNELASGIEVAGLAADEDEGLIISNGEAKRLRLQRIHATGINDPANIDNRLNALSTSDGAVFQIKRKPGRPPGSKTYNNNVPLSESTIRRKRYTRDAIDRMTSLGFDPLAAAIKVFRIAERELDDQCKLKYAPQTLSNGDVRRFSPRAVNDLLSIMQKSASDLMAYKYTKPVASTDEKDSVPPLIIGLGDGTSVESKVVSSIAATSNYLESEYDLDEGLLTNVVKVNPNGSVSPVAAGKYRPDGSDEKAYDEDEGLAEALVTEASQYVDGRPKYTPEP